MSDPRHHPAMCAILDGYEAANGVPAPDKGRIAKRLSVWLKSNPGWPGEVILRCIRNRYASEVNHGEEPWRWIDTIPRYIRGPLDGWGKPKKLTQDEILAAYYAHRSRQEGQAEN